MDRRSFSGILTGGLVSTSGQAAGAPAASVSPSASAVVDARAFGAVGDGKADDTKAIQAAIDFALVNRRPTVHLPAGAYRTSDTLHLGYGETFATVCLVGEATFSYGGMPGTIILAQAVDRPAINVQGGRGNVISGLSLKGRNAGYVDRPATRDGIVGNSDPLAWLDPDFHAGLRPFVPFCGIAIDAFAGGGSSDVPKPPAVPWKAGAPVTAKRAPSSDVVIDRCWIMGFAIGIAVQPADVDSNGDFTKITGSSIGECVYGVAVGNSQSRNVAIRDCTYVYVHTFLTNRHVGHQIGGLNGPVDNLSGGHAYQTLDISTATSLPLTISHLYFERQTRIGTISVSSGFNNPVIFQSCLFAFGDLHIGHSSGSMLSCGPYSAVKFVGCAFNLPRRILHLANGATFVDIDACMMAHVEEWRGLDNYAKAPAAVARALDYTCGGLFVAGDALRGDVKLTNGIGLGPVGDRLPIDASPRSGTLTPPSGGRIVVHHYARELLDRSGRLWTIRGRRRPYPIAKKGTVTREARYVAGDEIELVLLGDIQRTSRSHVAVGDLLHDTATQAILVVSAVESDTTLVRLRALLLTGLTEKAGVPSADFDVLQPQGVFMLYHASDMVSDAVWFGDFRAGSPRVANVHPGDGAFLGLGNALVGGDILFDSPSGPPLPGADRPQPYPAMTRILDVDERAGVVTLDKAPTVSCRFALSSLCLT